MWWFDGGENGKTYGKRMNVARQSCEYFSSMGIPMETGLLFDVDNMAGNYGGDL